MLLTRLIYTDEPTNIYSPTMSTSRTKPHLDVDKDTPGFTGNETARVSHAFMHFFSTKTFLKPLFLVNILVIVVHGLIFLNV